MTAFLTMSFSPKRVAEFRKLSFDFVSELAAGESIADATWTATVHEGADANPNGIISGAAAISGTIVTQLVVGGVDGTTYLLQCEINTSAGQRLHGTGLLAVTDDVQE